jgi:HJR/Mrr/RecB family endonuclease
VKTEIVAWWGAVLATIVFLWDIYKWRTAGRKLRVSVQSGMKSINMPQFEGKTLIHVNVSNYGDRPTTITNLGYQITLTPASRDGGKDIYAAKKDHLGTFLYVVECKRYAPDHPVGVGLVRQLNGVVQAEQATAGILAATSFFTREAKEFQRRISNQMSLKDYVGIQEWLKDATRR